MPKGGEKYVHLVAASNLLGDIFVGLMKLGLSTWLAGVFFEASFSQIFQTVWTFFLISQYRLMVGLMELKR